MYAFFNPTKAFFIYLREKMRRRYLQRRPQERGGDLSSVHEWLDSPEGQEWSRGTFQ